MNFTALISQYSFFDILGLENAPEQQKQQIIQNLTFTATSQALQECIDNQKLTEEQQKQLLEITQDPIKVQEKILEFIPDFNTMLEQKVNMLKVRALEQQVKDLQAKAEQSLINNPSVVEKVKIVCSKLLNIIETDTIQENDENILEAYQKVRSSLNFNQ